VLLLNSTLTGSSLLRAIGNWRVALRSLAPSLTDKTLTHIKPLLRTAEGCTPPALLRPGTLTKGMQWYQSSPAPTSVAGQPAPDH
jgi:hypothetical protein